MQIILAGAAQETTAPVAVELALQPIFALRNDGHSLAGFELLYRPEEKGALRPNTQAYIEKLEQTRQIGEFDRKMWRRGLGIAPFIAKRLAHPSLFLNINLSGQTLSDPAFGDFLRPLASRIAAAGMRIQAEVTETARADSGISFVRNLGLLRRLGVGIILDDFPQGENNMPRLLAYNELTDGFKLDKSVTDEAVRTQNFRQVIHYMNIARHNGKDVVAEGVSSLQLARELAAHGVHYGQGYGLGKPVLAQNMLQMTDVEFRAASPQRPLHASRPSHFRLARERIAPR